ncbi:MAG: hypothetical protein IKZ91_04805 [Bacteroidales bacterium]|nr:hypothetical protein [Bacteroidales bacterium]
MKRLFLSIAISVAASVALQAQQAYVEEVSVDTRATFHQQTTDGVYDSHFQGDYLNLHIKGQLSDQLTFRVRQRLNKKVEDSNPFNATDFLWLTWQPAQKWSFTFGKHPIMVGGYEVDSAPIDVYYYGTFTNNLYQYYAFGVSASFHPTDDQTISAQFIPSPISPVTQNAYSYNLYWNGHIQPWWKTIWSYNLVEDELHRKMNWVVLGNKFDMGKLVVDMDFVDRVAFGQKNPLSDWSVIGKAILTLGKIALCTKVGYERNDASNVDPNWNHEWDTLVPASHVGSYDLVLPAGNDYFYYGAGIEYFPLGNDTLRLHLAYFGDNHDKIHNYDFGVTWRFKIYSRSK